MKTVYVSAVLLFSLFAVALSLSCMPCDKTICGPKPICKGGYTKSVCGCCDVCAKLEGESCGGYWNHYGRCDTDLTCVSRRNGELINKALDEQIHPGHCEDDMCANLKCGLHQKCTNEGGTLTCACPRHCKNEDKPVCGLNNGKQYRNQCYLRRYECKTAQRIAMVKGPCKYCAYKGQIFKFGEQIKKNEKCQVCSCAHGKWNCIADPTCRRPMPIVSGDLISCVVPGPRGRDACPEGSMCAYVNTHSGQHGRCVPVPTTTSTPATKQPTTECPLRKCKPCKHGFEVDDKGCRTCQCKQVNMCHLPKSTGSCKEYFPRFYFNKKTGKCTRFIYSGCKSNGNNFQTKKECEFKCLM